MTTTLSRETAAALTLQKAWRHQFRFCTTRTLVNRFLKTNVSMAKLSSTSAKDTLILMHKESLNRVMEAYLGRIHRLACLRHRIPIDPVPLGSKAAMFAFLTFFHCGRVFRRIQQIECKLLGDAADLVARLERILQGMEAGGFRSLPRDLTQNLPALFMTYGASLVEWQAASNAYRNNLLRTALADAYRMEERTAPNDAAALASIQETVARLRSNMRRVMGAEASDQFEAQYRSGQFTEVRNTWSDDDQNGLLHELLFDPNYELRNPDGSPSTGIANTMLREVAPTFAIIGPEFERERLLGLRDEGVVTLQRVRLAVQGASLEMLQQEAVTQEQLLEGQPSACEAVQLQMILLVLLGGSEVNVTRDTLPETLRLDVGRVLLLRALLLDITTRCAMIATLKCAFRSTPQCPELEAMINRLHVEDAVAGSTDQVIADLEQLMPVDRPSLRETTMVSLRACVDLDDMVHRLMRSRVADLLTRILGGHRSIPVASAIMGFMARIRECSNRLVDLVRVNRMVHMPTYIELIKEAALTRAGRLPTDPVGRAQLDEALALLREVAAMLRRSAPPRAR